MLPSVWNRKVDPTTYPGFAERNIKPVTWRDLEDQFHTLAFRSFEIVRIRTGGRRERIKAPPRYKISYRKEGKIFITKFKETLDLYTKVYEFGRIITPMWNFIVAENFREVIDEIAQRNLYVMDISGYVPTCTPEALWWAEFRPPLKIHRYLLEKLGSRFLGWENGEQDGRYFIAYAKMYCPAPVTRRQAYKYFLNYFRRLCNDLHNYICGVFTLPTFAHYFADMGNHRLLGAEVGMRGSMPMWFAFIRGAGKQYGILWFADISLWNRWGAFHPEIEKKILDGKIGPTCGPSFSLFRRLFYIAVMYDCCMVLSFEFGRVSSKKTITREINGKLKKIPALTVLGKLQLEIKDWVQRHPNRGVMYTPVALLIDFYTGWAPPRHHYSPHVSGDSQIFKESYIVWGNMPYQKSDHQIDLFFREVFPGYEDAGYYRNERGCLTPTPCGDIFDVLLSNVPDFVLHRYNATLILGETYLEGKLLKKIKKFVESGGSLAVFANQLREDAEDLTGIRLRRSVKKCDHAILCSENLALREPTFTVHELEVMDAKILVATGNGEPLVTIKRHPSDAEVIVFAADYGLSDCLKLQKPIVNECDRPLPSPYMMLEHVRAILLPWLRSFNLVEVIGPPIQYITSVTNDPSRLLLTLCNNDIRPWCGNISIKNAIITRVVNWMTDKPLLVDSNHSHVFIRVAPHDVVVLELYADRPVVRFKGE